MAALHPEIVLHQPKSLPYGGIWRGRAGFMAWLDAFASTWSDVTPSNPTFHTCGGGVLVATVTMHAVARSTGRRVQMPMCQVIRFSDGLPLDWRNFAWDTAELVATLEE